MNTPTSNPHDVSQLSIDQRMDILLTPREFLALKAQAKAIAAEYAEGPAQDWPSQFEGLSLREVSQLIS